MNITVIVPTYRRPQDLARCLQALQKQTRPADEVIVTVRDTDAETWNFFKEFELETLPFRTVTVTITGVVAAMNAGLDIAKGDIIAFTDDDAAPRTDWLERIEAHFLKDKLVGGVGGRDLIYKNERLLEGAKKVVGKLQWFGRTIGNHHIGIGEAREVDILKGVNMSFRRSALQELRFDERMKGTGAQVHFELVFCLSLRRKGWKLIYDPNILVDHYCGQRFDEDKRDKFNGIAMTNKVHNETLALLEYFSPLNRFVFAIWAILIGNRGHRGLLQCLRYLPTEGVLSIQKFGASLHGRWLGWQTWRNSNQTRGKSNRLGNIAIAKYSSEGK